MNPETLQKCSTCGCKKLLKFFKIRENTGEYYKTCNECCEKYKCTLCDYKCSTNCNLQRHIKIVHDQIKDIKCTQCDYKCSTNCNLQRHIKQVHDQIKDIKCTQCDYTCSTNCNLQRHIKQVHDQIKDFECTQCDYKCSTNSTLKQHIKMVHDQIKNFECTQCDYKCSMNGDLQRHIKICTGSRNISSLELRCIESLQDLGFEEDIHYSFNNTYSPLTKYSNKYLRPDIRFINYKKIIELDGIQHFIPQRFGNMSQEEAEINFELLQQNDKLKDDFCKQFGYKMIRISYKDISNILSILHNELQDILDF